MLFEQISEPCMSQTLQGIDCKRRVITTNQEMCFEPNIDFNIKSKAVRTTAIPIPNIQVTKEPIKIINEEEKTPLMDSRENNTKKRHLISFFRRNKRQ